ncbi:hypothetical protein [uncultured Jannaschia sp.]|uniref:hypothetical protein n=1 Tax=uncultured Jannaschia sp. TaxID=293347 RepID=UPI002621C715|nr:hypothetical protein [uncultured Jannaschia sp.]
MKITRISRLTGVKHTREIDLTPAQLAAWDGGELIQDAAPHLSDADREFVKVDWDAWCVRSKRLASPLSGDGAMAAARSLS